MTGQLNYLMLLKKINKEKSKMIKEISYLLNREKELKNNGSKKLFYNL